MSAKATIVATGVSLGILIVGLIVGLGTILMSDHSEMRADIRQIQTTLADIGHRVAHIEGRLSVPLESEPLEDG